MGVNYCHLQQPARQGLSVGPPTPRHAMMAPEQSKASQEDLMPGSAKAKMADQIVLLLFLKSVQTPPLQPNHGRHVRPGRSRQQLTLPWLCWRSNVRSEIVGRTGSCESQDRLLLSALRTHPGIQSAALQKTRLQQRLCQGFNSRCWKSTTSIIVAVPASRPAKTLGARTA